MSRHRLLRALGPALLLAAGGAYALASWNWCGAWGQGEVTVTSGAAEGALSAGAAAVPIAPPFPVVVAGYPPPRPLARRAELALQARALVLRVGEARVGLVSVELLTLPASLEAAVRAAAADLKLAEVWVIATHAHSSLGGYEDGLLSELAGTGAYRAEARAAVVKAAAEALRQAASHLAPATLELGEGSAPELVVARDDEPGADSRLLRARFTGADGKPLGGLVLFSAHPTLRPRDAGELSPDYPGHLAALRQPPDGVTLVLQGDGGNATANLDGQVLAPKEKAAFFAGEVSRRLDAVTLKAVEVTRLSFARARVALPRPDSSRLVPGLFRAAGDNFLCASAPREAEVGALAVGPLRLLSVPGEPTAAAGAVLEGAAEARLVALANGYLGYVNAPAHVRARQAESRRQYFGPELLDALEKAARAAAGRL